MHFAVFIDDILKRRCIALKEELHKEAVEHFEADSWYEAGLRISSPQEERKAAFICLPIHAAYLTYIDIIDAGLIVSGKKEIKPWDEDMSLIYDPLAMKSKKMLNRELRRNGVIEDIIAGNLIVIPEGGKDSFDKAYEIFGKGQVFIYNRKENDIKTIKCSAAALAVLRENNISIIA